MRPTPFLLERFFAKYEFTAPYLLSSSDCESMELQDLLALEPGAADKFNRLWLGYGESTGKPELRSEIAGLYRGIDASQVLVHVGAQEAIFNLLNVLLSPGDEAIVQFPCYQSGEAVAEAIGCKVHRWSPEGELPWQWDTDQLKKLVTPRTRILYLTNPHNPTGYLMPSSQMDEILRFAEARGFFVVSDEVYRGSEHRSELRTAAACERSERGISVGVLSKSYGLAGLRVGWIATQDAAVMRELASFKDYTTICGSVPGEFLATLALRHGEKILNVNRERTLMNLELVEGFFAARMEHFAWSRPEAGCLAFVRLKQGSAEKLAAETVENSGVLLIPSTQFLYGDSHLRFGFGRANLPKALAVFAEYFDSRKF